MGFVHAFHANSYTMGAHGQEGATALRYWWAGKIVQGPGAHASKHITRCIISRPKGT